MKICILNSFYAPDEVGGAERSVRALAEALVIAGHNVTVICNGRIRESTTIGGVNVERLPTKNFYFPLDTANHTQLQKLAWHAMDSYNPLTGGLLHSILADLRPDVLHTNTLAGMSVSVWATANKLGIPIVHTLRDYYLLCANTAMYKQDHACKPSRCASCRVLSLPRINATQHVNVVVGNSDFILQKHLTNNCFKNAKKSVIYNAYQPPTPTTPRGTPGVNAPIRFGYIGRLASTKGVEMLIEAYLAIRKERPGLGLKLVIAGRGDTNYENSLKLLATDDQSIEFIGQVRPEDFYSQIDYPVVPSLWEEPLARVLFESFAHGLPVIASDTGGSPELISLEKTGWLFSPKHFNALLDKIRLVLDTKEQYSKYSEYVLEFATTFLPSRVVADYLSTYQGIADSCNIKRI